MATRERLDVLMVSRGLAESREQARRLVMAGQVRVGGGTIATPGRRVPGDIPIEVVAGPRFVSRGGDKLDAALNAFGVAVAGRVCLDVGCSTGGFTDCLLQAGARHVFAVDVGRGQLHWRLRRDPRVTVLEGVNARYLTPAHLRDVPSLACVDVSFISLTKVLPAVIGVLSPGAELLTLVKPQFEAGRREVSRGGVVRDAAVRARVLDSIRRAGEDLGLECAGSLESPLRGPAGNVEFWIYWRRAPVREESRPGPPAPNRNEAAPAGEL